VSTVKQQGLHAYTLLLVAPVDPASGEPNGTTPYVAVDLTGAGIGEMVVVSRGSAARISPGTEGVPTDAAIVAIVDSVVVAGAMTFSNSA
jgi:microcompartment protein CcmK/EutM